VYRYKINDCPSRLRNKNQSKWIDWEKNSMLWFASSRSLSTEQQVSEIAHDIRMDLNLHDLYKQVDQHIMNYVNAAGIDNKDHWVEPHLPDLDRDLKEEVGIEFD